MSQSPPPSLRAPWGIFNLLLAACLGCGGGSGAPPVAAVTPPPSSPPLKEVFVSPAGLRTNPGTLDQPTTLEGAQSLLRATSRSGPGALRVTLRGGLYFRTASFTLLAADSGSAANPIEYAAYAGEVPRLIGGASLAPSSFKPVDASDPNWSRLDPSARASIYVADLSAYKTKLGNLSSRSDASLQRNYAMEVFTDGQPLTLARYPKFVEPAAANLAPHATIRVTGILTPDATGDYAYAGLDGRGNPYYTLTKNGVGWCISLSGTGPDWRLSKGTQPGVAGTSYWGSWETFSGPAGNFAPAFGATGAAFLAPADGSNAMPGFLLIRGTNGTNTITAPEPHLSRWNASEAMYYGFGWFCWNGSHSPISSIDPASGTIVLSTSPEYGFRVGQPFFAYNLLEELTAPGEYFIDRVNARLYLRPLGDTLPAEVLLSLLQDELVQMDGANYTTWRGVVFEGSRDRLAIAQDCQNAAFNACTFRNAGGYGLLLRGYGNLVEGCQFSQLGQGGVWVNGGNRQTLALSGTVVENCEFQRFGRLFWSNQPAVNIDSFSDFAWDSDCMGITVQHNEIHHSPHTGIFFNGSALTIQYNHLHDTAQWSNDAGAIYTIGRDWGTQGNLVQFNLVRNCGQTPFGWSLSGIYIDGVGSGVSVTGNILYNSGPGCALQHNGGRDVQMRYNIISGNWTGAVTTNFGMTRVDNVAGDSFNLLEKLQHFNYQSAPWSTAYPGVAAIPNSWAQLQGSHWLEPENCVFYGNLLDVLPGANPSAQSVISQNNLVPSKANPLTWFAQVDQNKGPVDPQFTDPAHLNFTLRSTSPMFAIPGFPGIDTSQIGIQR